MKTDSVTQQVTAPPDLVYDLISDVERMGEWSPECYRCRWIGKPKGPAVGSRFKAHNKRGLLRWSNSPKVLVADKGREFAFSRTNFGAGEYLWRYHLEPTEGGGTEVTESYEEVRPETRLVAAFVNSLFTPGGQTSHLQNGMAQTLERIKKRRSRTMPVAAGEEANQLMQSQLMLEHRY
jgi:uncharacterized protein YndB with AHSA1/START domain